MLVFVSTVVLGGTLTSSKIVSWTGVTEDLDGLGEMSTIWPLLEGTVLTDSQDIFLWIDDERLSTGSSPLAMTMISSQVSSTGAWTSTTSSPLALRLDATLDVRVTVDIFLSTGEDDLMLAALTCSSTTSSLFSSVSADEPSTVLVVVSLAEIITPFSCSTTMALMVVADDGLLDSALTIDSFRVLTVLRREDAEDDDDDELLEILEDLRDIAFGLS